MPAAVRRVTVIPLFLVSLLVWPTPGHAAAMNGSWWRTLGVGAVFTVLGAAPGPLIGILLLIFASASVEFVNALSSLVFAFTIPIALIGATLLYQQFRARRPRSAPATAAAGLSA